MNNAQSPSHKIKKVVLWLQCAAVGCALDQLSKSWCIHHLMVNELIESSWLPSVAVVRFVNRGLAWGYGSGIPDFWLMPYVCYWPLVCLVALTAWALWQAWRGRLSPLESLGLAAMVGGGSSNVLDSWRLAYVVDTVAIKLPNGLWQPGNGADGLLILGGLVLLATAFKQPESMSCEDPRPRC